MQGFSFFEMMMTVMILSVGLVMVYKAFFLSLKYTKYLTHRLHGMILLDTKIAEIERSLLDHGQLPFSQSQQIEEARLDNKQIDYQYSINFHSVENLEGLFELDISLSWMEDGRTLSLSRSVYLSNNQPISKSDA